MASTTLFFANSVLDDAEQASYINYIHIFIYMHLFGIWYWYGKDMLSIWVCFIVTNRKARTHNTPKILKRRDPKKPSKKVCNRTPRLHTSTTPKNIPFKPSQTPFRAPKNMGLRGTSSKETFTEPYRTQAIFI